MRASLDATSLLRMLFAELMVTVQFFESSSGRVPDSFLNSLRAYVVVAPDFDLAIGGSSLVDSIRTYHLRLSDPVNPVPGLSQGGDSIVPFLYRLVASSGSSPLVSSSASTLCHGGVLDVSGSALGSSLPPLCSSLSGPSSVSPLTPSVAPFPSSLPLVLAPPGFRSSSFTSSLPQLSSLAPTFPVHSPSVTLVASSLPFPAPPVFPVAPPFNPLAPAVGLRHPAHSLAPLGAPYSFPVSSLLPSVPAASSPPPPPPTDPDPLSWVEGLGSAAGLSW